MAGSDYKQVLFCCNLSDINSLENHCGKHVPFAITDNLSIKIIKDFVMTIGGVNISTGDMDFVIEDTFVYVDHSCLFWINEDKFGFGGILYADDKFANRFDFDGLKYKIFNLVRKYRNFNSKKNIAIHEFVFDAINKAFKMI